jgi:hypothetical protein
MLEKHQKRHLVECTKMWKKTKDVTPVAIYVSGGKVIVDGKSSFKNIKYAKKAIMNEDFLWGVGCLEDEQDYEESDAIKEVDLFIDYLISNCIIEIY